MPEVFNPKDQVQLLEAELKKELQGLPRLNLASVALGTDPTSAVYRSSQKKLADRLLVGYRSIDIDKDISFTDFAGEIKKLNSNPEITGIIINKPFKNDWQEEEIFSLLDENKDVEGVHPLNLGKLLMLNTRLDKYVDGEDLPVCVSPTLRSILYTLSLNNGLNIRSKKVTVVGFSSLIGKPLTMVLANALATVSIAHIGTSEADDLSSYVSSADILISAVGIPSLIKGGWIKKGAIVIDVGTGRKDGRLCGDVEFEAAKGRASFITPSPGGIGRLTPFYLFSNLVILAKKQQKH